MPPLPTTLSDDTKNLIASLERRQKDLHDFRIPRLRSCKGPLATQQQFAAELREDVETFARQIEALDVSVDDQKGEKSRRELRQIVEDFKTSLTNLRKDARSALLMSKRAVDANALSNREELLRSSALREKQNLSEQVAEDALMTASNNVTEALQRTLGLMQGELEKSVLSTQLLDASSASLRSASSTHDVLDGLMQTSKHLITALEKSDWLDRLLIIAALVFFILVVLFIIQQRVVNRGLRVAFWWTRFLPSSSSGASHVRNADIEEKSSILASSLTSVAVTAATSLLTSAAMAATTVATSQVPSEPLAEVTDALNDNLSQVLAEPDTSGTVAWMSDSPTSTEPDLEMVSTSSVHDEL